MNPPTLHHVVLPPPDDGPEVPYVPSDLPGGKEPLYSYRVGGWLWTYTERPTQRPLVCDLPRAVFDLLGPPPPARPLWSCPYPTRVAALAAACAAFDRLEE